MSRIGLQYRIAGGVVLGLVVLFSLFGLLAIRAINESKDVALEDRLRLAEITAETVDALIQHTARQLEAATLIPLLGPDDTGKEQMEQLYQVLGTFDKIVRLDPNGQVLWIVPASAESPDWALASERQILDAMQEGQTAIAQVSVAEVDHPPIAIVITPILDGSGAMRGFLAGELHLSHAGFTLVPLLEQEGGMHAEVVDARGYIVAHSALEKASSPDEHASVLASFMASGRPGTVIHRVDGESSHVVAYYPLKSMPGGVVVEQLEDVALALPKDMERTILVFGLGSLVVASGAAWLHARTIVRPIRDLTNASKRIAAGSLDDPVAVTREDEVGELARSFDTMRVRLRDSLAESRRWTDELETRVHERTQELESLSRSRAKLLGKIISAQEEERLRISRELHDETAQELVQLVRGLEQIRDGPDDTVARSVDELIDGTRETLKSVRRFSRDLRPSVLDDLGLMAAIEAIVEDTNAKLPGGATLRVKGEPQRVAEAVELALFRIAQESLRNVEKHANAKSALVELHFTSDAITLSVSDDGAGFDAPRNVSDLARAGKLGLVGMKERCELVGGSFDLQSSPGEGTRVAVTVRSGEPAQGVQQDRSPLGTDRG